MQMRNKEHTRTNDIFLSLSGLWDAELVLIASPPLAIFTFPHMGMTRERAALKSDFEPPKTSLKYLAILSRNFSSG